MPGGVCQVSSARAFEQWYKLCNGFGRQDGDELIFEHVSSTFYDSLRSILARADHKGVIKTCLGLQRFPAQQERGSMKQTICASRHLGDYDEQCHSMQPLPSSLGSRSGSFQLVRYGRRLQSFKTSLITLLRTGTSPPMTRKNGCKLVGPLPQPQMEASWTHRRPTVLGAQRGRGTLSGARRGFWGAISGAQLFKRHKWHIHTTFHRALPRFRSAPVPVRSPTPSRCRSGSAPLPTKHKLSHLPQALSIYRDP